MGTDAIDSLSPLASDLRANDPDRYTATLFAPPQARTSLIALYAFDHELARLRTVVREPMAGLIRLQWWEDVVDGLEADRPLHHPVVQGLRRAVADDGLDVGHLKRAIDGRRRPFEEDQPPSLQTFERHLRDIGGGITSAAAALLGVDDERALATADRVGTVRAALEQVRLLERSTDGHGAWLPSTWLEPTGDRHDEAALATVLNRLAEWALAELAHARHERGSIARSSLAAFFPGTLAGIRLRSPRQRRHQAALPTAVPKLLWCWLRGRF